MEGNLKKELTLLDVFCRIRGTLDLPRFVFLDLLKDE